MLYPLLTLDINLAILTYCTYFSIMISGRVRVNLSFVTRRVCHAVTFEPLHRQLPLVSESTMENPHAERQAILLERILKNTVSRVCPYHILHVTQACHKSKCTEMILELNHCVEVNQNL